MTENSSTNILAYENIVLIEAIDHAEAKIKAEIIGENEVALDDELTIDGVPGFRIFAGIRKIVEISKPQPPQSEMPPTSGCEITFNEYVVEDYETLMRLGGGGDIVVNYLG